MSGLARLVLEYIIDPVRAKERDENVAIARRIEQLNDQVWCLCVFCSTLPCHTLCAAHNQHAYNGDSWEVRRSVCLRCAWTLQTFINYGRTKSMFGVSSRDFVTLTHFRVLPDGRVVALATRAVHPSCPEEKGVRSSLAPGHPCTPAWLAYCFSQRS